MAIKVFHNSVGFALSVAVVGGLAACSAPNPPPAPPLLATASTSLTTADVAFLQQVDEMDLRQSTIAKLAATHSNSDVVKAFAATVDADHTTNRTAVAKIASGSNLTLADKLDQADQAHVNSFTHLYGSAFDRVFLREVVTGNDSSFDAAVTSEAQSGTTPEIKTLANDTQAMETAHVSRARDLMGEHTIRGHHRTHGRHQ